MPKVEKVLDAAPTPSRPQTINRIRKDRDVNPAARSKRVAIVKALAQIVVLARRIAIAALQRARREIVKHLLKQGNVGRRVQPLRRS